MTKLILLEDIASLEGILAGAGDKPVLLFKHSAT